MLLLLPSHPGPYLSVYLMLQCYSYPVVKALHPYFEFETIFDDIAEDNSCSEHGETEDTSMYCMYVL